MGGGEKHGKCRDWDPQEFDELEGARKKGDFSLEKSRPTR